jgi:UDP-N-acetylglucosamine--N-acetylmuramyl-(pentapeptide) pyrophosphoryl-undecaprenol N-acetylglucosamine transferase
VLVETQQIEIMKKLKVLISGGGSGGHIFPALAIAKSLESKVSNIEFLFVGANNKMEMEKIPNAGYEIIGLWISGFHRRLTFSNLLFPVKLIYSLISSYFIINKFNPDLVIGTGGFASGPILYVAAKKKIPTLIQEQNSYAGITNRILSSYVNKVCVAYDDMQKFFPAEKIILTGNPIRDNIITSNLVDVSESKEFEIDKNKLTVLVIGGSLGAKSINTAIKSKLHLFKENNLNLIWQTGESFGLMAQNAISELSVYGIKNHVFVKDMHIAYQLCDIIISRAGAIAISEICCIGKPTILVPSPNVAENHQYKNAQSLVNKKAALVVNDKDANDKLVESIINLYNNKVLQSTLGENIKKMEVKNSANTIANIALKLLND